MTYSPVLTARQIAAYHRGTAQIKVSHLAIWFTIWAQEFQDDAALMALYHDVDQWLPRCMKACGADPKGHVANPVKKRAEAEIQQIERARIAAIGNVPLSMPAWAAWWVYMDAVIHDVVCCWPGGRAQCWLSLGAAVEAIARAMLRRAGGEGEEAGSGLYEQAMKVVGWA